MLHAIAENYNNDTRRLELQVIAEFIVFWLSSYIWKVKGFISDFSGTIQSVAMAFAESGCYPAHVEKFSTTHATIKFAIIKESFNFEELTNGLL